MDSIIEINQDNTSSSDYTSTAYAEFINQPKFELLKIEEWKKVEEESCINIDNTW